MTDDESPFVPNLRDTAEAEQFLFDLPGVRHVNIFGINAQWGKHGSLLDGWHEKVGVDAAVPGYSEFETMEFTRLTEDRNPSEGAYPGRWPEWFEAADVDVLSIEDAHRHNDLALLERFATTRIALGVIGIARTRVEPVDEIADRLIAALAHIDAERLIAAPDCGLTMLDRDTAWAKLANLAAAAKTVG
jgi:hypothetical protein